MKPKRIPKVETLPDGTRIVKRYRQGRCYAAVWSADTTDRQVAGQMAQGEAAFFPFNEASGQFVWDSASVCSRPLRFKR